MDNQRFQFAILAAQGVATSRRPHHITTNGGIKRIFRIGADRAAARQAGRR
jgi:hypothetical protein